jgi:hypothetical protein
VQRVEPERDAGFDNATLVRCRRFGRGNREIALPSLQVHRTEPMRNSPGNRHQYPTLLKPRGSRNTEGEPIALASVCAEGGRIDMAKPRKSTASRSATGRKTVRKRTSKAAGRESAPNRWSQRVTRESDALDLKHGVFTLRDPKRIAAQSARPSAVRAARPAPIVRRSRC